MQQSPPHRFLRVLGASETPRSHTTKNMATTTSTNLPNSEGEEEKGEENSLLLSVQVYEQVVNLVLPNRERATVAEVISELFKSSHSAKLVGKRVRLIFSGRVLNPTDVVGLNVPLGAVVHCAIQDPLPTAENSSEEDNDVEEAPALVRVRRRLPGGSAANLANARNQRSDPSAQKFDFIVGFSMGFAVGPLMCFWLLEQGPAAQKVGILMGIFSRSMLREYHELALYSASQAELSNEAMIERNSFEVIK